ncbi:MAG: DUF1573 domain-containing protein [Pirellulales bacterium]
MKTSTILLYCVLNLSLAGSLFGQVLDPFGNDSKPSDSTSNTSLRLSQKPDLIYAQNLFDLDKDLVFDLGRLVSGCDYLVELNITSKLKNDLKFDKIKASCGCLGGIPKELTLKPDTALPIRTLFTAPGEQGTFEKQIVLDDSASLARLKVTVKGSTEPLVMLANSAFAVGKPGRYTFETKAKLNFPDYDFGKLLFRIDSAEFAGWRFIPTSSTEAAAYFDVVVTDEELEQTARLTIRDVPNKLKGTIQLRVIKASKPTSRPSEIILRKREDGSIRGRAIIQMQGLPDTVRENSEVKLKGKVLDPADNVESSFELTANLKPISAIGVFAEISLPKEMVITEKKLFVLFEVGNESFSVPMSVFKE